jgi:succinate dehydrogenase/fumarate reductase flavoprotein subunit
MTTFNEYIEKEGHAPPWPYPVKYDKEQEIEADVLVLGGGIAGCWAAISAARKGVKVAVVEKSATVRSGSGGPGCDHWCDCVTHPLSKADPDEWVQRLTRPPYSNGIGREIQVRENWDTLQEMEQMGGKIRDYDDKYLGAEGRDDASKIMISPRSSPFHNTNAVIRVWGTTFKPALKKECERLGVKIYDRVMATSLLTEGGKQGGRVIGATGVNSRTGEFMVFKCKAAVLTTAGSGPVWMFNSELGGITTMGPRTLSGDGIAMAWKAGAEFTLMESSGVWRIAAGGHKHKWYTGAGDASYENVMLIDNNGQPLPRVAEPSWGIPPEKMDRSPQGRMTDLRDGVLKGEYALPFWGDFPGMKGIEREVIWDMMLKEESTTKIIVDSFNEAGFNSSRDLLANYALIEGISMPQWRQTRGSGIITDWNLKTSLEGLYAAGMQLFSPGDHSFAASTGRYAGRKAADYAAQIGFAALSKEQVAVEKARVYAPVKKTDGIDWKELHAGIARAMQFFCSEYKTEALLKMGLHTLNEIEANYVPRLFAPDPHKLVRGLEDLSMLTHAQIILQASLARKASSRPLDFQRIDYPELDPPDWSKFLVVSMKNGKVKAEKRPMDFAGNLKEEYEVHNKDYKGVFKK